MTDKKKDEILYDHNQDGIDRRGFLKCMAWAGTGTFCVIKGGVLNSYAFNRIADLDPVITQFRVRGNSPTRRGDPEFGA